MKKLFAIAAFLLASSAAQAQYTFEYGGRTIRIDPDRGTVSIPGVYDNSGRRKRSHNEDGDRQRKQTPQQAKTDPQAPDARPAGTPWRRRRDDRGPGGRGRLTVEPLRVAGCGDRAPAPTPQRNAAFTAR